MFNVQGLTKMLAGKDLAYIQSYANAHKNDPLVVATALHVANMKKEMQAAQQGMAGRQPMPKVVDQDIAGIAAVHPQQPAPAQATAPQLPEEQGIGQLPAQNLQGMAGGGIVAFDEGGEVERFQVGGVPSSGTAYAVPGMTQSDLYTRAKAKYEANQPLTPTEKALLFSAAPLAAAGDVLLSPINAVRNLVRNPLDKSPAPSMTPLSDARTRALYGDTSLQATPDSLGRSPSNAEIEAQYLGLGTPTKTIPTTGQTGVGTPPAADKTGTTPAPTDGGIGMPSASSYIERFKKELPAMEKAPTKEDITKEYNDVYAPLNEKMQAMLDKERGKLSNDKEKALFMAMLRGGLAAAGGTSQYGLTNLAKGFEQGAVDYAGSLKDLRQAAKEQTKMEMDFEKAKADLAAGNLDRYYKRLDATEERNAKIRQLQASGVAGLLGDEMRARATVQAAGAAANAQLGMFERLGAAKEDSALRKGFDIYKQTGAEPTLYANYAKLSADTDFDPTSGLTKGELFRRQYPSFQAFMAGFGGGAGQVYNTLPQNAPVLKSPSVR